MSYDYGQSSYRRGCRESSRVNTIDVWRRTDSCAESEVADLRSENTQTRCNRYASVRRIEDHESNHSTSRFQEHRPKLSTLSCHKNSCYCTNYRPKDDCRHTHCSGRKFRSEAHHSMCGSEAKNCSYPPGTVEYHAVDYPCNDKRCTDALHCRKSTCKQCLCSSTAPMLQQPKFQTNVISEYPSVTATYQTVTYSGPKDCCMKQPVIQHVCTSNTQGMPSVYQQAVVTQPTLINQPAGMLQNSMAINIPQVAIAQGNPQPLMLQATAHAENLLANGLQMKSLNGVPVVIPVKDMR